MLMWATGHSTDALTGKQAPITDALMSRSPQSNGFSLLELLVVVFIIGILATMFTLSIGVLGEDSELDEELDRLQALMNLAREDAVTQGRELGMHFYPDGYEFAVFQEDFVEYFDPNGDQQDQSKWVVTGSDTLLKPRRLPEGIVIELEIEGRQIVLKARQEPQTDNSETDEDVDKDKDEVDEYRPQVWLYSTGDMSPFVIRFRREFGNEGLFLEFNDDGEVELGGS